MPKEIIITTKLVVSDKVFKNDKKLQKAKKDQEDMHAMMGRELIRMQKRAERGFYK